VQPAKIYSKLFTNIEDVAKSVKNTLSDIVSNQNFDGSWDPPDILMIFGFSEKQLAFTKYVGVRK
jgi:hypothetical protein